MMGDALITAPEDFVRCPGCEELKRERDEAREIVEELLRDRFHRAGWPDVVAEWKPRCPWLKDDEG